MKINVEGAELQVLSGGRRLIGTYFPLIFLSTHSAEIHRECATFLKSMGYAVHELANDKIWAMRHKPE